MTDVTGDVSGVVHGDTVSYVVVVRLSVHVYFNVGLSPRDSGVSVQRPSVCSISLTVLL